MEVLVAEVQTGTLHLAKNATCYRSLLATLAWFDIFDYPLTVTELSEYRYSFIQELRHDFFSITDIFSAVTHGDIEEKDGYLFLKGRGEIVETRKRRYRLAEKKFRRAIRVTSFLRILPSVRCVAVCNSLAFSNADTESDIDFFVIVQPKMLWVTRFFAVSMLALFGMRPRENVHADTICMSFFLSEKTLNLSTLRLGSSDTYLPYWIASLVPLFDAGGVFEKFWKENKWIFQQLPHVQPKSFCDERGCVRRGKWNNFLSPLLSFLNPLTKFLQSRWLPKDIREMANKDCRVMVSDDILKFHTNDRRDFFQQKFEERLRALNILS